MDGKQSRHLAAILAADVVGWSKLMRLDEEDLLRRMRALRGELVDPTLSRRGGRIVKLMGDGMLVEFASAVDAVRAAVDVQKAMVRRNVDVPKDQRIVFRIGVNLDDVIAEGEDVFGDGVNIAARLETNSPEGGICVSAAVHEQIRDRLDLALEDMGPLNLHNIDRPVRAWRWMPAEDNRTSVNLLERELSLPDKPSIAVLPFDNMSRDPEQDFFAEGIAEDIITALSRIEWFFVAARNSSFTYKGRATTVQQVGRDLGVRYVLEGSVRSSGQRLRVTAQLIDAWTGAHVWAEKFDREMADIFDVQDEISRNVVASLQTQIQLSEGAIPAVDLGKPSLPVWMLVNRAWSLMYQMEAASLAQSIELAERAVALDPGSGRACQILASAIFHRGWMGFSSDFESDCARSTKFAERAVKISPQNEYAHWILGLCRLMAREHWKAIAEMERAIEINPNCSLAYGSLATVQNFAGQPDMAIGNNEIAIRSNPRDPSIFYRFTGLAISYYMIRRLDASKAWARKAVQMKPEFLQANAVLIASLAEAGEETEATNALDDCLRQCQGATLPQIEALPFRNPAHLGRLTGSLERIGFPR